MLIDEETGERTIWSFVGFLEAVEGLGDASRSTCASENFVTIDLPEHVLAHMAKEQQRLVAEATEQMNSRTKGGNSPRALSPARTAGDSSARASTLLLSHPISDGLSPGDQAGAVCEGRRWRPSRRGDPQASVMCCFNSRVAIASRSSWSSFTLVPVRKLLVHDGCLVSAVLPCRVLRFAQGARR